jgi:hypothetical protein
MKKLYEYIALALALFGMYNLFKLTINWMHGEQVKPLTVWLYGGATILTYLINKILEKQNQK